MVLSFSITGIPAFGITITGFLLSLKIFCAMGSIPAGPDEQLIEITSTPKDSRTTTAASGGVPNIVVPFSSYVMLAIIGNFVFSFIPIIAARISCRSEIVSMQRQSAAASFIAFFFFWKKTLTKKKKIIYLHTPT